MIGGQIIIPLRNANNEKFTVTATPTDLKSGTYEKILRAVKMQKELVFEDVQVQVSSYIFKAVSFSFPITQGVDASESFRAIVYYINSAGTASSVGIIFKKDNTVVSG